MTRILSHGFAFAAGVGAFMVGAYLWLDKRIMP